MKTKMIIFSAIALLVGLYPFIFKCKVHAKNYNYIIEGVPGVSWGAIEFKDSLTDEIDVPLYSVDGLVRRATASQLTDAARRAAARDDA